MSGNVASAPSLMLYVYRMNNSMPEDEHLALVEWTKVLIDQGRGIDEIITAIRTKEKCSFEDAMNIHAVASYSEENRRFHEELIDAFEQEMEDEGAEINRLDGTTEIIIDLNQAEGSQNSPGNQRNEA